MHPTGFFVCGFLDCLWVFSPVFLFLPFLEVPLIFNYTHLDSLMAFKDRSSSLCLGMATEKG